MLKKLLVLALLIPGMGCLVREERGGGRGHRDHHDSVVVTPVHVHRSGCGHVFRGGVWITVR